MKLRDTKTKSKIRDFEQTIWLVRVIGNLTGFFPSLNGAVNAGLKIYSIFLTIVLIFQVSVLMIFNKSSGFTVTVSHLAAFVAILEALGIRILQVKWLFTKDYGEIFRSFFGLDFYNSKRRFLLYNISVVVFYVSVFLGGMYAHLTFDPLRSVLTTRNVRRAFYASIYCNVMPVILYPEITFVVFSNYLTSALGAVRENVRRICDVKSAFPSVDVFDDLRREMRNHHRLCEITRGFFDHFQFVLPLSIVSIVFYCCLLGFALLNSSDESFVKVGIWLCGLGFIANMIRLLLVCICADDLSKMIQAPFYHLIGLELHAMDPLSAGLAESFINRLRNVRVVMSAGGYFTIHKPLFTAVIGLVLTYSVILAEIKYMHPAESLH